MAYNNFYSKKKNTAENDNLAVLKARIKNKSLSGVYIFRGEEEYMKRFYFSELCGSSGDTDANVTVIDESDFTYEKFYDAVTTAPAIDYSDSFFADEPDMSDIGTAGTVRVIKAEGAPIHKLTEREKADFERLCENFPAGVCAVLYYPHNPKRESDYQKSIKIVSKCDGVTDVEFFHESPTSPLLKKWVKRHFDSRKCVIDAASVDYFIEAVGNDMCTLLSEIEKLSAYASLRELPAVYDRDIDFVCIRNTEAKLDDISKGIIEADYSRAMTALYVLEAEKLSETYIFGAISKKINELATVEYYKNAGLSMQEISAKTGIRDFVVKNNFRFLSAMSSRVRGTKSKSPCDKMINILSEYDIKLKSSPSNKYLLLENMIFRLCKI